MLVPEETFRQFKKMVDRVLGSTRSDFYRTKYRSSDLDFARDLKAGTDIMRVPFLSREELAATHPTERCFSDYQELRALRYTSGTTGSPILLSFRTIPRYRIPGQRPLLLAFSSDLNVLYALAPRSAPPPLFPPLIGHPNNYQLTAALAATYGIDAIASTPTRLLALAPELSDKIREAIEEILIASEPMTHNRVRELQSWFPNANFDIHYGLSEVNSVGYQCDALRSHSNITYHGDRDYLIEFTDAQTGEWVNDGAEGEIVLTELYESPHQLIRYRTGDAGRVVRAEPCVCGAPFTFEVTGRIGHDIVKVAGGVIRTDEVERVLKELGQWFEPDFRGVVEVGGLVGGGAPTFTLSLISKAAVGRHSLTVEQASQTVAKQLFVTPTKTLADFLAEGRLARFEIIFVEAFPAESKAQRLLFRETRQTA